MLTNYFKAGLRNIVRNKTFTALHIAGLAISLTVFILMALYIEDELSFDKFHTNADNIYRVADDKQTPDVLLRSAQSAAPVGPALLQEYPQIKRAARMKQMEALIKHDNKIFEERNIFLSDPDVFNIFSFELLKGDPNQALRKPESVVLTVSTANKYFGKENPIGQIISVGNESMHVTGIMEDVPFNSHLQFDLLISMATAEKAGSGYDWLFINWYSNSFYTYLLLPDHYDISKLAAQMSTFDERHKEANSTTKHHYAFEKLPDIYLHSDRANQAGKTGSLTDIYIFSVVALFVLLIACINFINLSTARSVTRAKEVAIKKVAGAAKRQIIKQFLLESFLLSGIAVGLSLFLTILLLPYFNIFSGKQLSINLFSEKHIVFLLLIFITTGFLSGLYPAFVLSRFTPITALKGKISTSAWSLLTRKGLVIFQFAVSVILIICSLVVYVQMNYLQQHPLGFSPSQTMVINFEGDQNIKERMGAIQQQLLSIPGVDKVSASSNVPGDGNSNTWSMDFVKKGGDTVHTELPFYGIDFNYLDQFNIPVVYGRALSESYPDDTVNSMLINETALKQLGFASPKDAIGTKVGMYPTDAEIVGVVKDFHFESLQKNISPLAMRVIPFTYRLLSVELSSGSLPKTVSDIQSKWKTLVPERPLEFSFLDETFNKQYEAQIKFGQVFGIFTVLAILIACFGLFGLSLFSVQQRTKEVGVRKVLGASVASITFTLGKDFIKLVFIAIVVGSPLAYFCMQSWLNHFAYRIAIHAWIFLAAGISVILIAFLTVSSQAVKAAIANPVKSLRTE